MEITYNKQYKEILSTPDWELYSDVNFKDSLIVWELLNFAKKEKQLSFEEMHTTLKELYKNRTVKSKCQIYKDEKTIEITTKGTFPRFYILKNK